MVDLAGLTGAAACEPAQVKFSVTNRAGLPARGETAANKHSITTMIKTKHNNNNNTLNQTQPNSTRPQISAQHPSRKTQQSAVFIARRMEQQQVVDNAVVFPATSAAASLGGSSCLPAALESLLLSTNGTNVWEYLQFPDHQRLFCTSRNLNRHKNQIKSVTQWLSELEILKAIQQSSSCGRRQYPDHILRQMSNSIKTGKYKIRFYCEGSGARWNYATLREAFEYVLFEADYGYGRGNGISFQDGWVNRDVYQLTADQGDAIYYASMSPDKEETSDSGSIEDGAAAREALEPEAEQSWVGSDDDDDGNGCHSLDGNEEGAAAGSLGYENSNDGESQVSDCEECCSLGAQDNQPAHCMSQCCVYTAPNRPPPAFLYVLGSGHSYCGACLDRDLCLALRFAPGRFDYMHMSWCGWEAENEQDQEFIDLAFEESEKCRDFTDETDENEGDRSQIAWRVMLWSCSPYENQFLYFVGLDDTSHKKDVCFPPLAAASRNGGL